MIHSVDERDVIPEMNNNKNWYNLVAPLLKLCHKNGKCNVTMQ